MKENGKYLDKKKNTRKDNAEKQEELKKKGKQRYRPINKNEEESLHKKKS